MNKKELALQLTLKAMEKLDLGRGQTTLEGCGKGVANLYNSILDGVKGSDKTADGGPE